ncbi:KAP family P-loop NTPase fold protein [Aureimonas glaciei]|nr:P-loop NTPase fold protein [Aureimonas glaciei]
MILRSEGGGMAVRRYEDVQAALEKIWADDLLGRKEEAEFLHLFLVNRGLTQALARRPGAYVLNVDADWGSGKSFFMTRFQQHLEAHGNPAVYVDAWQDDFTNEPFTAVMSAIDKFVKPHLMSQKSKGAKIKSTYTAVKNSMGRIAVTAAKGVGTKIAEKAVGAAFTEINEIIREQNFSKTSDTEAAVGEVGNAVNKQIEVLIGGYADEQLKQFDTNKKSLVNFRDKLAEFLILFGQQNEQYELPFFVLVDELDRCRPTYAIEMLERIKHLFDVPNLVFVLSTNTDQLGQAVRAVYGDGFDGHRYLDRFFTRTYKLAKPSAHNLGEMLWKQYSPNEDRIYLPLLNYSTLDCVNSVCAMAELTPRQIERFMEVLTALIAVWNKRFPINILVMAPLIAMMVRGHDVMKSYEEGSPFQSYLLSIASFKLKYEYLNEYREKQIVDFSVSKYISEMIIRSTRPLNDEVEAFAQARDRSGKRNVFVVGRNTDDAAERLCEASIIEEYNLLRTSGVSRTARCLVQDYPGYIAQAGRLVDEDRPKPVHARA